MRTNILATSTLPSRAASANLVVSLPCLTQPLLLKLLTHQRRRTPSIHAVHCSCTVCLSQNSLHTFGPVEPCSKCQRSHNACRIERHQVDGRSAQQQREYTHSCCVFSSCVWRTVDIPTTQIPLENSQNNETREEHTHGRGGRARAPSGRPRRARSHPHQRQAHAEHPARPPLHKQHVALPLLPPSRSNAVIKSRYCGTGCGMNEVKGRDGEGKRRAEIPRIAAIMHRESASGRHLSRLLHTRQTYIRSSFPGLAGR